MRVAIIGSRNCEHFQIKYIFRYLPDRCTAIISGGARGIDSFAKQAAAQRGIPFLCIPPDYRAYGRGAPLMRNRMIVKQADYVLAFWDFRSRGTAHAIAQCIARGVPVRIIGLDECGR